MHANKSLGQNFLINNFIANKIANSLSYKEYNTVVEVGPGMGAVSKYLFKYCKNIFLIEIDKILVNKLKIKYPFLKEKIIYNNFLNWDPYYLGLHRFGLIGNFPYNISSKILYKIIHFSQNIPECIGMFQKELFYRIIADKGSKLYGILSVLIQTYYDIDYLFTVDKNFFYPKSLVTSYVIRFLRKKNDPKIDKYLFIKIVKKAFNKRRKILRNVFGSFIKIKDSDNIPFLDKRAESISVNDFIILADNISKLIKND